MESGATIRNDASAITMHSMHKITNPPMIIPVHASGRPLSLCLRILPSEISPKMSARMPSSRLAGKQINPVNGKGSQPMQKVMKVKTPSNRLVMDWLLS